MSRELVIQFIEKKRAIYQEKHDLESKYSALLKKHAWLVDEEITSEPPELALQAAMLGLKDAILSLERRVNSAHFFGPRYTRSLFPTLCIECFVNHDRKESLMVEVPVGPDCWDGKRQFECSVCKHVLRVDHTMNI